MHTCQFDEDVHRMHIVKWVASARKVLQGEPEGGLIKELKCS